MSRGHILLVEDAADQAHLIRRWLERERFNVTVVRDGAAGLALCRRAEFDLVMTDIQLPFSKGNAILEWSKREYPRRPVILLSAYALVETTSRTEVDGFLEKPLDRVDTLAMVVQLLDASVEWRIERTMRASFEMAVLPFASSGA